MVNFAFEETGFTAKAVTELFDFVWPAAIGLWNLRWQVKGFVDSVPNATTEQAHARFVLGSGIHGADVKAMIKNRSWEYQQERLAEVILTNAFAIYESWAKRIAEQCPQARFGEKDLAFPVKVQSYIAAANATPSAVMTSVFKPTLQQHKKYKPAVLGNMLLCYRYFKEIRNTQMHGGGVADQKTVDACTAFAPVATIAGLDTKEAIEYLPVIPGKPVKLSIRGVVGFCDILLRLMVTIDAELSGTMHAEATALERLRQSKKSRLTLGKQPNNVARKLKGVVRTARLPEPTDLPTLKTFLLVHRFVSN